MAHEDWNRPLPHLQRPLSSRIKKGGFSSENAMGGWKKEGGGKPHEWHPSQKRVLDPPSYGTFSTPLRCQCSVFPVPKSTTEQTKSSFGGVQKLSGERVLWYVFLPPYVLHPPISPPNFRSSVTPKVMSHTTQEQQARPEFKGLWLEVAGSRNPQTQKLEAMSPKIERGFW